MEVGIGHDSKLMRKDFIGSHLTNHIQILPQTPFAIRHPDINGRTVASTSGTQRSVPQRQTQLTFKVQRDRKRALQVPAQRPMQRLFAEIPQPAPGVIWADTFLSSVDACGRRHSAPISQAPHKPHSMCSTSFHTGLALRYGIAILITRMSHIQVPNRPQSTYGQLRATDLYVTCYPFGAKPRVSRRDTRRVFISHNTQGNGQPSIQISTFTLVPCGSHHLGQLEAKCVGRRWRANQGLKECGIISVGFPHRYNSKMIFVA